MLCPESLWLVEPDVYVSIPAANLIVAPSPMTMMLATNKERNHEKESSNIMLKRRRVSMVDQISYKPLILLIQHFLKLTEGHSSTVDDR